jgi:hypothetical protein
MANFLERTIASLTKEVVREEIPVSQRKGGSKPRPRRAAASSRAKPAATKAKPAARSRSTAKAKPRRKTAAKRS